MKNSLQRIRQNKDFRIFCFTTFNALVSFCATYFSGMEGEQAILFTGFAIPFLNAFSKYINTRFFDDIGVQKDKKMV